jgi:hypothetical protein
MQPAAAASAGDPAVQVGQVLAHSDVVVGVALVVGRAIELQSHGYELLQLGVEDAEFLL